MRMPIERLILMRHGDAERGRAGQEDFDRALTDEGRSESRGVSRALAAAGIAPDLALVSSAARTVETWTQAKPAFPHTRLELNDGLYAASSARIAATVREAAGRAGTLIVVGHNPGIHQFALHLARQSGATAEETRPLYERFPTGSAVVFNIDSERRPRFDRLFLAKHFREKKP